MSTTPGSGHYLVIFVAAGDGSETARDTVARKLAEKFGAPFERMLASVHQCPRVFKRNLNREQAESYAALLRSMGAEAEVQLNGSSGTPDAAPPAPSAPQAQEEDSPGKPPPPEATDRSCPFCGRALQAGGICVICKPREVGPETSPESQESSPPAAPEPEPAPIAQEPAPAMEPAAGLDPNFGFQDPEPAVEDETVPVDGGWAAPAPSEGIGPLVNGAGPGEPVEHVCSNCSGLLNQDGQCPVCDLGAVADTAAEDSTSIENDLSALLSPEELGVCPNCCGPMEQDGTCLICPPAEPAVASGMTPPTTIGDTAEAPPPALSELPLDNLAEAPVPAVPGPGVEEERSPFEPLTPLEAEPAGAGTDVCRGCGGPKGTDGTCLICGEEDTDGADGTGSVPDVNEMTVTGNEPPPADPVAPADTGETAPADTPTESKEQTAPAAGGRRETPSAGKKPGVDLGLTSLPRALTIPLLATILLIIGGITTTMTGSFLIASGIWFLALIAGLVTVFNAIRHFEYAVASFPKLPKPVIFAFLCFLFIAGSGGILAYSIRQSALFLLDKASEKLQAEADRLVGENGLLPGMDDAANKDGLSTEEVGGQIIMEEEMLERAIIAEREGDDNPKAALETWSAYLEGFPDGTRASEAKRKVSQWRAVVKREDALATTITRDRRGNNDPTGRIRDWKSCLATYGNTPAIRAHAEERIVFWEAMLRQRSTATFPYWAAIRLDDGRTFSGKVVAENDRELKMELPNRLKMKFSKGEYELIESDHINGKRIECENMRLVSGVTTERPTWGREDGITILGEDRAGVEAMVSFRVTGFYHFEVMARAGRDRGGFPSVILSLNGEQQERIRFDSEEWKLYKVTFPFRIPAGEQRLEILFPPQYQTMQDKRVVAIDYFTTSMVE